MTFAKMGALVAGACAFLSASAATTYYVDVEKGNDEYDGKAPEWKGGRAGPMADGVNDCLVKAGWNPFRADDRTEYAVRKDCGSGASLLLGWMTPDSLDCGGKPRTTKNADGEVVADLGCYQFWRKPGLLLFVR